MPTSEEPCELGECEVDASEDVPEELVARDESEADFELDAWARWDQPSDFTEYYDVIENGEGHTGYDGSEIWKYVRARCFRRHARHTLTRFVCTHSHRFIHGKICFQKDVASAGNEWKGDFNRLVSGMHSAVSASIVKGMEENGDTEQAMIEYKKRLQDEPAAVANLHFTYMLVLCAVNAAKERLDGCSYLGEGPELLDSMKALTSHPLLTDSSVQLAASNIKQHVTEEASTSAWKLRLRTRDLLRIMNCVQCNICRLHGKVSALGLAASLQVLLGTQGRGEETCDRPPDPTSLHRVEVAAMITFCAKLSDACEVVKQYEAMAAGGGAGEPELVGGPPEGLTEV